MWIWIPLMTAATVPAARNGTITWAGYPVGPGQVLLLQGVGFQLQKSTVTIAPAGDPTKAVMVPPIQGQTSNHSLKVVHTRTHTHARTHTRTHTRTHARTHTHTHSHTLTHTHTHTHKGHHPCQLRSRCIQRDGRRIAPLSYKCTRDMVLSR
jgi:hypothetical protein